TTARRQCVQLLGAHWTLLMVVTQIVELNAVHRDLQVIDRLDAHGRVTWAPRTLDRAIEGSDSSVRNHFPLEEDYTPGGENLTEKKCARGQSMRPSSSFRSRLRTRDFAM